jgi:hypothetical protein
MADCRCCWPVLVPAVLVWMGVVVANGLVVASTVFGIALGYLGCWWGLVPHCMLWGRLFPWICWRPPSWILKPCHCLMFCPRSSEMWGSPGMCLLVLIAQIVFEWGAGWPIWRCLCSHLEPRLVVWRVSGWGVLHCVGHVSWCSVHWPQSHMSKWY